jgi:hypothetical protein
VHSVHLPARTACQVSHSRAMQGHALVMHACVHARMLGIRTD